MFSVGLGDLDPYLTESEQGERFEEVPGGERPATICDVFVADGDPIRFPVGAGRVADP